MAPDDGANAATERREMEKFDPSRNEGVLLEVTSFSTSFRKDKVDLKEYLQEVWPTVKRALKKFGVSCKLNLEEGSMTVSTTRKTRDPYIVVKARDLTELLARSVPTPQALKILNDEVGCDIIKIGKLIHNRKRFSLRRDRILGPNMSTLQAIESFTGCYILVQGGTVAAMGSFSGLEQVRKIVEGCIKNKKDPISHIQELRTELELAKKYALAIESQERENIKRQKSNTKESSHAHRPSPPPQQPSKKAKKYRKSKAQENEESCPKKKHKSYKAK